MKRFLSSLLAVVLTIIGGNSGTEAKRTADRDIVRSRVVRAQPRAIKTQPTRRPPVRLNRSTQTTSKRLAARPAQRINVRSATATLARRKMDIKRSTTTQRKRPVAGSGSSRTLAHASETRRPFATPARRPTPSQPLRNTPKSASLGARVRTTPVPARRTAAMPVKVRSAPHKAAPAEVNMAQLERQLAQAIRALDQQQSPTKATMLAKSAIKQTYPEVREAIVPALARSTSRKPEESSASSHKQMGVGKASQPVKIKKVTNKKTPKETKPVTVSKSPTKQSTPQAVSTPSSDTPEWDVVVSSVVKKFQAVKDFGLTSKQLAKADQASEKEIETFLKKNKQYKVNATDLLDFGAPDPLTPDELLSMFNTSTAVYKGIRLKVRAFKAPSNLEDTFVRTAIQSGNYMFAGGGRGYKAHPNGNKTHIGYLAYVFPGMGALLLEGKSDNTVKSHQTGPRSNTSEWDEVMTRAIGRFQRVTDFTQNSQQLSTAWDQSETEVEDLLRHNRDYHLNQNEFLDFGDPDPLMQPDLLNYLTQNEQIMNGKTYKYKVFKTPTTLSDSVVRAGVQSHNHRFIGRVSGYKLQPDGKQIGIKYYAYLLAGQGAFLIEEKSE